MENRIYPAKLGSSLNQLILIVCTLLNLKALYNTYSHVMAI